ncbi:MAG: hypothetical protein Q7S57_02440 [bacterium]|nr:hypothetical protein [bacterium]
MVDADTVYGQRKSNWVWVIMLVSVLLFAGILIFQTREIIVNNPIISEGVAYAPVGTGNGIDVYDNQALVQEFIATETEITHISVGLKNFRGADAGSFVSVGVYDHEGVLLGKEELQISELWSDDFTRFKVSARLLIGGRYNILITTRGVGEEKALSAFYEPKIYSLPGVQLFSKSGENGASRQIVGHIGFKVLRESTPSVLWHIVLRGLQYRVLLFYALLILIATLIRPVRIFIKKVITTQLKLSVATLWFSKREIFSVLFLGVVLAGIVTAPYYLLLNKMDSMGDVHRNLLFRALGRESILKDGTIAQWDPYTCGGVPLLANIESAHTDPFFLLSLVFGENLGLRLSVTLTLAFGFFGTYLLARRFLGVNKLPAILAGAIYSFSGFQMLAFSTGVFAWIPVGLIPLFVYFYLRSLEKNIYLIPTAGMLAWIFLGGGPHMPVFAVILVGLLAIGVAIGFRSLRPILMLYLVLITAGLFSAVKLLPAVELVVIFDAFNRLPSFIASLSWLPKMFIDRHQDASFAWHYALTGENYRWSEFGSYVGLVPVLLFLFGLPFIVRKKMVLAWLIIGLIILVMVFGFFPWTLIQQIPVLKEIVRNPQRLRSIFFLPFGLLCAYGLNAVSEKLIKKTLIRNIVVGLVVLFVIGDLFAVGAPNFYNLFNLSRPKLERQEKFVRLNGGYTDEDSSYYKAGYLNYLAREGTTDLCVPNMVINRPMMASGKGTTSKTRPYKGEAYILNSDVKADVVSVSPTKIIVQMEKLERDGWLAINQNYYPGWKTVPKREVAQKNGLVAARVLMSDKKIVFKYFPLSFYVGFWISFVSVLIAGAVMLQRFFLFRKNKFRNR